MVKEILILWMANNSKRKFIVSEADATNEGGREMTVELIEEQEEEKYFDENQVFEWDSYEFEYHEKGKNWTWGLVGIAVFLLIIFVVMKQWSASVLVVVSAIVVYMYALKEPKKLHYILTKDGLLVEDKNHPLTSFGAYWISHEGVLYLEPAGYLPWPPRISIVLTSVDVKSLENFLAHYVKKEARSGGDTSDTISKWLKL